jgi:hypothetical protein
MQPAGNSRHPAIAAATRSPTRLRKRSLRLLHDRKRTKVSTLIKKIIRLESTFPVMKLTCVFGSISHLNRSWFLAEPVFRVQAGLDAILANRAHVAHNQLGFDTSLVTRYRASTMLLGFVVLLLICTNAAATAATAIESQLPPGYKIITQDGFVFKDQQHLRDVAALHGFVKKVRFDLNIANML